MRESARTGHSERSRRTVTFADEEPTLRCFCQRHDEDGAMARGAGRAGGSLRRATGGRRRADAVPRCGHRRRPSRA